MTYFCSLFRLFLCASVASLALLSLWFLSDQWLMVKAPAKSFHSTTCLQRLLRVPGVASDAEKISAPTLIWLPQPTPIDSVRLECLGALPEAATRDRQSSTFRRMELLTSADRSRIHFIVHQLHANFSALGLELFLVDGSLLGSARHFGFIPWDADVDVMIRASQMPRAREFLANLSARQGEFLFHDTEGSNQHWQLKILCAAKRSRPGQRLHPQKECRAQIDFFFGHVDWWNVFHRPERPYTLPASHIYPLRLRPFGRHLLPTPRDPDRVLARYLHSSGDFLTRCQMKYAKSFSVLCDRLRWLYPFTVRLRFLRGARELQVEVLVRDSAMLAIFIDPTEA